MSYPAHLWPGIAQAILASMIIDWRTNPTPIRLPGDSPGCLLTDADRVKADHLRREDSAGYVSQQLRLGMRLV